MRMTDKEKIFVKSVRGIETDKFKRAFKRKDGFLVVKFKKTKWVLKPSGFIEEIYELVDGKWVIQEREF